MNTQIIGVFVLGALLGGVGVYLYETPQEPTDMHHAMESMTTGLEGKTGDAFDQAFLSEMIVHHEGAVAMAEAARVHAAHQEIRDLAQAIITAQNAEIAQMHQWQKEWYPGVQ